MSLADYSDDELINEIKRRGIEIKVHVSGVTVDISLGDICFGETNCEEKL